jgi:hypothetical protein
MHPSIAADQNLRELALSEARNTLGASEPLSVFLQHECLTLQEYEAISRNPTYARYLKDFKQELSENGFSFSAKARVLAEDLLADIYRMAKDVDTPAAMRVKTLENLVDWGKLAPKNTAEIASGPGYSITINLNSGPKTTTLDVEATEIRPKTEIILPSKAEKGAPATLPRLDLFPEPDPDTGVYYIAEAMEAEFGSALL